MLEIKYKRYYPKNFFYSTNDKQDFDLLLNKHMLIEAKLLSSTVEIMDMVEGKGMFDNG